MKLFLSGLIFICCTAFLQSGKYPVVKLFAYQQKVSGGANFSSEEKKRSTMQHYVYLLVRNGRTITIDNVWIGTQRVSFKQEEIKAPVRIENSLKLGNNNSEETLVPETTHTVIQIVFTNEPGFVATSAPSRYRNYPLLLQYRENGRTYFLGTKKWTVLNPQVNQ